MMIEIPSSPGQLAKFIDHTLLRPEATEKEIEKICQEAREFGFRTVCVERRWLKLVGQYLQGTEVVPITVIGFPGGEETTSEKVDQTTEAVQSGAKEVDMVLNRRWLKQKDYIKVCEDIRQVVTVANEVPVKVILETCDLTDTEKAIACSLCQVAGAAFVKTSTGFGSGGATDSDVRLMRETVSAKMGVKASGGIRNLEQALTMIRAGANRLGTSASVSILRAVSS